MAEKSSGKEKRKAVFFDRDGVLVRSILRGGKMATPLSMKEFEVEPAAKELAAALSKAGFLIFVVTNQPDIARQKLDAKILEQMHEYLLKHMGGKDILRGIYVCPHDDRDGCHCRKPKPGMLLRAASDWNLDLEKSFFIGDHARDVGAGKSVGCQTILIRKDYNQDTEADEIADDLKDAVGRVLAIDRV
ncbi:MAG TPA: HAD-IIIA family hydrolase [Candidatus Omnitrophota bacterium]|nr:HAD-IIIA family hydrolase [Candidatus Omnitrophota bacterium]